VRLHEKRRAKLALADEDCQYDAGPLEVHWSACMGQHNAALQDAQKGRPARPFEISLPLFRGATEAALYCAHPPKPRFPSQGQLGRSSSARVERGYR
jgi:hypothetical protein